MDPLKDTNSKGAKESSGSSQRSVGNNLLQCDIFTSCMASKQRNKKSPSVALIRCMLFIVHVTLVVYKGDITLCTSFFSLSWTFATGFEGSMFSHN